MKKKITTLQVKQKEELKRARDDADVENLSTGKYENFIILFLFAFMILLNYIY